MPLSALQPAFSQRLVGWMSHGSSWLSGPVRWSCILLAKDGLKNFLEFLSQFAFWKQEEENSFKIDYLMTRSQTYEKNI